ncbi:type II secretion system secretin GspD, partial [PVC group bacterium]|nr:type II secretion system secretin GspD [PVC group bacterium]
MIHFKIKNIFAGVAVFARQWFSGWQKWSCRTVFCLSGCVAILLTTMEPAFGQGTVPAPPAMPGINRARQRQPLSPSKTEVKPKAPEAGQKDTKIPEVTSREDAELVLPSATASDALSDGLKFNSAPLDIVLEDYGENTGMTLLRGPGLSSPTFTLRSQGEITIAERLKAIETILSMHGIGLVPIDDNFIKVVPIKQIRREPMDILEGQEGFLPETTGELVSQMIVLKHIDIAEATKAIEPLKHEYGQINQFERTGSILVTDTAPNINRMLQVIRYIDQPVEAREEPHIIQIRYAKASDIKQKLEELIADYQKEQKKSTVPQAKKAGSPAPVRAAPPGVIRARVARAAHAEKTAAVLDNLVAMAEKGIIRGKVKIIADERTNILIIITRPENMKFFDKIVAVLDIETTPDVMVKVIRLEFAQAKDVASMLNDLIGATGEKDAATPAKGGGDSSGDDEKGERSKDLREYVKELAVASKAGEQKKSNLGELSKDNIKILSDERTNALILMSSRGDMMVLEAIIRDMDMMLSQVLIEVVILEIGLSKGVETGVDWIQRSMVASDVNSSGGREAVFSYAGGGGGGGATPANATTVGRPSLGAGLTYYFTHYGLNTDVILKMAARDSNSRILSSPVIVTHDNTEAKIDSSQQRYFYKGQRYVGGNNSNSGRYEPDVESKDVGIHLTVTPHVNEKKLVLMEITQEVEQLGEEQLIEGEKWPTINKRSFSASIAVRNRETIVLGGLVKTRIAAGNSGIPFLRKIPLLGMLFRSSNKSETRGEVVVFITPYVMDTPEEIAEESRRRKESLKTEGMWKHGWSDSSLAERKKPKKNGSFLRFTSRKPANKPVSVEEIPYKHNSRVRYAGSEGTGAGEASPLNDSDLDKLMGDVEDKWQQELENQE